MEKRTYLGLVWALGLALGLGACGGDDDGDNKGISCEGEKAPLIGSCLTPHGDCFESRGDLEAFEGADLEADCIEEDEGTWSTSACPASSKTAGGCVVELFGAVSISYHPDNSPEEEQAMCESIPFDSCFIPGTGGGGGGGDTCEGLDRALVASCDYEEGICLEYRGSIPASEILELQESCEFNSGAVWSTTAGCPADATSAGACVISASTRSDVVYHTGYTPAAAKQECESTPGGWCYVAP